MERVNGVNFDELIQGLRGKFENSPRGKEVKQFLKQYNPKINIADIRQTIEQLNKDLEKLSVGLNHEFKFRNDSFLIESFDEEGNMRIIFF
ncbi:MAG: hypothetical protein PHQ98_03895 [Candidatus ainarchaeum sp.]|nr:hypothetical protein [Candidatus ainarchaeum sp.]